MTFALVNKSFWNNVVSTVLTWSDIISVTGYVSLPKPAKPRYMYRPLHCSPNHWNLYRWWKRWTETILFDRVTDPGSVTASVMLTWSWTRVKDTFVKRTRSSIPSAIFYRRTRSTGSRHTRIAGYSRWSSASFHYTTMRWTFLLPYCQWAVPETLIVGGFDWVYRFMQLPQWRYGPYTQPGIYRAGMVHCVQRLFLDDGITEQLMENCIGVVRYNRCAGG